MPSGTKCFFFCLRIVLALNLKWNKIIVNRDPWCHHSKEVLMTFRGLVRVKFWRVRWSWISFIGQMNWGKHLKMASASISKTNGFAIQTRDVHIHLIGPHFSILISCCIQSIQHMDTLNLNLNCTNVAVAAKAWSCFCMCDGSFWSMIYCCNTQSNWRRDRTGWWFHDLWRQSLSRWLHVQDTSHVCNSKLFVLVCSLM